MLTISSYRPRRSVEPRVLLLSGTTRQRLTRPPTHGHQARLPQTPNRGGASADARARASETRSGRGCRSIPSAALAQHVPTAARWICEMLGELGEDADGAALTYGNESRDIPNSSSTCPADPTRDHV